MGSCRAVPSVVPWIGLVALILACYPEMAAADQPSETWRLLAPGVEYAAIATDGTASLLHVVRVDPAKATLTFGLASEHDGRTRTAGEWCKDRGLVVAINAGMYQADHRTNCGYLRHGKHVNNPKWNSSYKSALGFGPGARMVDLDESGAQQRLAGFAGVVQNLRLLKGTARNSWGKQAKRWSEAAVGIDAEGRMLFLFLRAPLSMYEFNETVKKLPVGVVRMMHVEGGPEASLSIHAGGIDLDLSGSFETGFNENDNVQHQWPIPNVLGVKTVEGLLRGDVQTNTLSPSSPTVTHIASKRGGSKDSSPNQEVDNIARELENACQNGRKKACDQLHRMWDRFEKRCENGEQKGCVQLSRMFASQNGIANKKRAMEIFFAACDEGEKTGCDALERTMKEYFLFVAEDGVYVGLGDVFLDDTMAPHVSMPMATKCR